MWVVSLAPEHGACHACVQAAGGGGAHEPALGRCAVAAPDAAPPLAEALLRAKLVDETIFVNASSGAGTWRVAVGGLGFGVVRGRRPSKSESPPNVRSRWS
ncbi:hypothetical protein EON66_07855 [archaeon]|nr:MAG: hypothetical protein EON66_07855 [archaeon]